MRELVRAVRVKKKSLAGANQEGTKNTFQGISFKIKFQEEWSYQ